MASVLVLCTMAHERDVTVARELLEKTHGEFLSVVLDAPTAGVDRAIHKHFGSVVGRKSCPGDAARLTGSEKSLTRSQRRHPDVVAIDG